MIRELNYGQEIGTRATMMTRARRFAWIAILAADVGLLGWGAMAAFAPEYLPGPGSVPILAAEYQNYTGGSWQELSAVSPRTVEFITVVFRMYGIYIVAFGLLAIAISATAFRRGERWAWWALLSGNTIAFVSAMMYDWTMNAIGPLEMTEYLGLAAIYAALAVTAPILTGGRPDLLKG